MSAKTEDVEVVIERLEADAKYLADHINAIQVRYIAEHPSCRIRYLGDTARDLRTLLASHATLSADMVIAEDALVSQTALVRSQAERIASLEAVRCPDKPTLMRIISAFTPCTADDGVICCEACHCSRLADAIISGKDSA